MKDWSVGVGEWREEREMGWMRIQVEGVCVCGGAVLPVLVPGVIITQSDTFSDTFLGTDTSLARNIRKALLRMNTLSLFGFKSAILSKPLSPYFKLELIFFFVFYPTLSDENISSSTHERSWIFHCVSQRACFLIQPFSVYTFFKHSRVQSWSFQTAQLRIYRGVDRFVVFADEWMRREVNCPSFTHKYPKWRALLCLSWCSWLGSDVCVEYGRNLHTQLWLGGYFLTVPLQQFL